MSELSPWLVVGLGNPGPRYAKNRHNIGHLVVEALAQSSGTTFTHHRAGAQVASPRLGVLPGGRPGPVVHLAWLESYMNVSGGPTAKLLKFFSLPPQRLLVIHDELDLPAHQLRLKVGGGEGGHNGLRSISQALGSKDYARLRIGIGRPPGRMDTADFVLSDFPRAEATEWDVTINKAAEVIEDIVSSDFAAAQQRLHTDN